MLENAFCKSLILEIFWRAWPWIPLEAQAFSSHVYRDAQLLQMYHEYPCTSKINETLEYCIILYQI